MADDKEEQAYRWAAKRLSREMTALDEQQLKRWLNSDPDHARILDSISPSEEQLDEIAEAVAIEDAVGEMQAMSDRGTVVSIERSRTRRRRPATWGLIAASGALLTLGVALIVSLRTFDGGVSHYEASIGEQKLVELRDGSNVILNTGAKIEVDYSRDNRQLTLNDGEAFFDVAPEKSRPFVVATQAVSVTVTGTVFNVKTGVEETMVSVISGSVDVTPYGQTVHSLQPGEALTVLHKSGASVLSAFDEKELLAWRQGEARYTSTPLGEVIADLNRYFPRPIVLADEENADLPVTGVFDVRDQATTVEALSVAFSLEAERKENEIILKRAVQ